VPGQPLFQHAVFEFAAPAKPQRASYTVALAVNGAPAATTQLRPLPAQVPQAGQGAFEVLLLSCYHSAADTAGKAAKALEGLRPDLSIFAGDQIYLDLPVARPATLGSIEARCLQYYRSNWFGPASYSDVVALGGFVSLPDDHEYWNNFPVVAPWLPLTTTVEGAAAWKSAAQNGYMAFQLGTATEPGRARVIEVPPLSMLLLDTRSNRQQRKAGTEPGGLLGTAARRAFDNWITKLMEAPVSSPRYGVLVTGQSLLSSAASQLSGVFGDLELSNYPADFLHMYQQLDRVTRSGLPVVCLTGDVHWGRVLRAESTSGKAPLYEIISSPAALFNDAALDSWKKVKNLLGQDPYWPRHGYPDPAPAKMGSFHKVDSVLARLRGDMALKLSFQRVGIGIDLRIDYLPLHVDPAINSKNRVNFELKLRPYL
jgi:hypothetical protein